MDWLEVRNTVCPIARCMAAMGDLRTMLIMRELFMDNCRFDGLQACYDHAVQVGTNRPDND